MVYLYQEGSFYRAYEWSAWLCVRFINAFKVSNRLFKGEDKAVALIGFPPTSLSKFTPEGAEVSQVGEKCVALTLPEVMVPDGYDVGLMATDYEGWKAQGSRMSRTTSPPPPTRSSIGRTSWLAPTSRCCRSGRSAAKSTPSARWRRPFMFSTAGRRDGTEVDYAGVYGYYWSSTPNNAYANHMYFDANSVNFFDNTSRDYGRSVRLVQDYHN